ncbi:nctA [Scenedesmus sp. PABB004]|nr:nctA [Scenedesmus sp. PABB004]KAF8072344.1 nctA [Scenedesmus sp. PABB004]
MMQTDDDVGKIAQATPVMIARAMELFLQRLCTSASEVAAGRKAKTLTTSHLKAYVIGDELMDFLADTVAKAPDLPAEGEPEAPKPKRQRSETKPRASAEGKRASADGAAAPAAAGAAAGPSGAAAAAGSGGGAASPPPPAPPPVKPADDAGGSPMAHGAHGKLGSGFGGLGAHPFLAQRSFGRPAAGAKRHAPDGQAPHSPAHKQQAVGEAAAGAGEQLTGAAPADALPLLPSMLSAQALANFSKPEDDYDDDYDT